MSIDMPISPVQDAVFYRVRKFMLPFLGCVPAGTPLEAVEQAERFAVWIVEEVEPGSCVATLEPSGFVTDSLSAAKAAAKEFNRRELKLEIGAWAIVRRHGQQKQAPKPGVTDT